MTSRNLTEDTNLIRSLVCSLVLTALNCLSLRQAKRTHTEFIVYTECDLQFELKGFVRCIEDHSFFIRFLTSALRVPFTTFKGYRSKTGEEFVQQLLLVFYEILAIHGEEGLSKVERSVRLAVANQKATRESLGKSSEDEPTNDKAVDPTDEHLDQTSLIHRLAHNGLAVSIKEDDGH